MSKFLRSRTTTLTLLAAIQIHGLEAEYVAARRSHRFHSTRWIASHVIRQAAKDATARARSTADTTIDLRDARAAKRGSTFGTFGNS